MHLHTTAILEAPHSVLHRRLKNTNILNYFLGLVKRLMKSNDLCYSFMCRSLNIANSYYLRGPRVNQTIDQGGEGMLAEKISTYHASNKSTEGAFM